jgi:O-antigen ligase
MGKGFGIALGTEDGVTVDRRLRSPHNIWMTYLSRTGVPGVILWTLVVLLWGILLLRASRAAQQSGAQQLSRLAYFLFVFGCAFLINGFFDVYLEGPMGAVWFWTVFGAGLAVIDACRTPLAPGGKRPLVVLPLTALTKREGRVVRRSTSPESTG